MGFFDFVKKIGKSVWNGARKIGKFVAPVIRKVGKVKNWIGQNMDIVKNIPVVGSYIKKGYDLASAPIDTANQVLDVTDRVGLTR